MFDVALHTGLEHPSLAWILVPTVIAFFVGLVIGTFRKRLLAARDAVSSN
jgi:hypothetical protein